MGTDVAAAFDLVSKALDQYGLLLESDQKLPSVCSLVAGEPMRGSWWSHPKANLIFAVNELLEDHADVLISKLISGKVTFVHRVLWSPLFAIGSAREEWQLQNLSVSAVELLNTVESRGEVGTDQLEWSHSVKPGDAARELEKKLLIVAGQVHTETGAHAKVLESWKNWQRSRKFKARKLAPDRAREEMRDRVAVLNAEFHGKATLPWQ